MREFKYYKTKSNFEARVTFIHKSKKIDVKIDTGATDLVMPISDLKIFDKTLSEDDFKKNSEIKEYKSASGHTMLGYKKEIRILIKDVGLITLNAYFYDGIRRLFGLRELSKHFKFCINRDEFSLQAI